MSHSAAINGGKWELRNSDIVYSTNPHHFFLFSLPPSACPRQSVVAPANLLGGTASLGWLQIKSGRLQTAFGPNESMEEVWRNPQAWVLLAAFEGPQTILQEIQLASQLASKSLKIAFEILPPASGRL